MKIFWPNRSKAKGFSIENIASNYRERSPNLSCKKISDQLLANRNLKFRIADSNQIYSSNLSRRRGHWANRDFSEYREVS
tara:strand:- start:234 stop:473 length:240 start_codon:yes stop_codon:yes gene_type:complete